MGFDYTNLASGKFELPNDWRVVKVQDVATVNAQSIQKNYKSAWIEYIDIASVEKGTVKSTQILPIKKAPSRARRIVRDKDTLIATVRPNLEHYVFIKDTKPNMVASTGFAVVSAKQVEPRYLYYYLTTPPFTEYLSRIADSHTSTYPAFNPDVIENAELLLPPDDEQRAIAHILGALDDKIELNRQMNETLEGMARAIFKSWFVDFDPVRARAEGRDMGLPKEIADLFPDSFEDSALGEIPKGWRVGVVGDIASTALGGQWGHDTHEEGLIPTLCLRGCDMEDLRSEGFAPRTPVRFLKENAVGKRLPSESDFLIAASGAGPCGRPLWCASLIQQLYSKSVIYSNFVKRFTTPSPEYAVYLDRVMFNKFQDRSIQDFITGTSVPNLDSKGLLRSCRIVIPAKPILTVFYKQNYPYFQKLYSGENIVLGEFRDALLTKLISGELRVKDAERFVGQNERLA